MRIGHPPAPSPVEYEHSSPSSPSADHDFSPSSSSQSLTLISSETLSSIDWDAARRRFTQLDLDDEASSDAAVYSHRRGQSLPFDSSHGVPSKPDHGVSSSKPDYASHGVSSSNSSKPDHVSHTSSSSSNKAASGKGKASLSGKSPFSAFPNGTTIAMNVYSYPAGVPAQASFSGPIRPPGKSSRAGAGPQKKMTTFVVNEPTSPHVTCLGRVKIRDPSKRSHGKDSSNTATNSKERKLASLEKAGNFLSRTMKAFSKDAIADHQQQQNVDRVHIHLKPFSCVPASTNVSATSNGLEQTRRERAASLAQSLTELFEDSGRHNKADQNSEYSPSVPPPNSLLLMRTSRRYDDFPDFKVAMSDENRHSDKTEGLSSTTDESRSSSVSHFVIKVNTDRSSNHGVEREKTKSSTGPLSELEGNAMMSDQPLSAQRKACHATKLWQRRSLGELSAIEVAQSSPARRRN